MTHTPVPVVALSHLRTVGPVIVVASFAIALLISLPGFDTYEGKYSSGFGVVVLTVAALMIFVLFLPMTVVDCFLLLKRGCAAYVSHGRLGIYRASPWMPWRRGFAEVPLDRIRSIEIVGRSLRWGDVIRLNVEGDDDLSVETFYMRGRTEDVVNALKGVLVHQPSK